MQLASRDYIFSHVHLTLTPPPTVTMRQCQLVVAMASAYSLSVYYRQVMAFNLCFDARLRNDLPDAARQQWKLFSYR